MFLTAGRVLLHFAIAFLVGSIPFSLILGKLVGRDIRKFGEGNPGTANAFRAGGFRIGVPSLILDSFKGVVPVALLTQGASSWQIPIIAIAPVLGHAFSPFLRLKGGKAIATSFGIWTGLALWGAPSAMGLGAITAVFLFKTLNDMYKTLLIFAGLALFLLFSGQGFDMWALFVANLAIVAFKQAIYAAPARRR